MEFCLALPLEQKINNGWTRYVLHNAMRGILPPEVEHRADKADLSPNFLLSFARYAQPEIDRILRPGAPIFPYVNQQTVAAWWQRFQANPLRGEKLAMALYGVISLAAWLKKNNT
jgi:asparagine synthase (glutamine-hydrolysing)